jgi:hypothetical protein
VQVRKARRPVDIFRVAGDRCDPPVDRLPDLADHDELIDGAPAQRAEPLFPRLRQRAVRGSKFGWNFRPTSRVTASVIRLVFVSHVFVLGFAN